MAKKQGVPEVYCKKDRIGSVREVFMPGPGDKVTVEDYLGYVLVPVINQILHDQNIWFNVLSMSAPTFPQVPDTRLDGLSVDEKLKRIDKLVVEALAGSPIPRVQPLKQTDRHRDEPFHPKDGESFWFIGADGTIHSADNSNTRYFKEGLYRAGNCFKSRQRAREAAQRVREAYRGSSV